MLITGRTDKGLTRHNNQDCFAAGEIARGCYCVVCDGMGGQQGGEVASQLATGSIASAIERDLGDLRGDLNDAYVKGALEEAAAVANRAVFEMGEADDELAGMGTTLVAAVILDHTAYILHAGDSRAYLVRGDEVRRMTTDHTMVQILLDRGDITETESRSHPQRNYITRALGVGAELDCEFTVADLRPGDALLLCTDGLYNYTADEALPALMVEAVKRGSADGLIEAANAGGGGDNITAVILGRDGEVEA